MTEKGASIQRHAIYRNVDKVHIVNIVGTRQKNKYERMENNGLIEIISR